MRSFGLHEWREALEFLMSILPILLPILLLQVVMVIVALVGLFKKDVPRGSKVLWVIIIVVLQLIGPVLYFAVGSNMLDNVAANREGNKH